MSCTENESGSFVVFFLPALVGCLTILLARRWASSQVSNTSSTAVSRRRKIIKDPLIKRPLPTITCKMMPPGPKKATGVAKKVTLPLPEEEMNGGKRVGRTTRLPSTTPVTISEVKVTDGPIHPKHVPFPYIPQDGTLLFEAMTFMFVLIATGLQFLNLYRTAWWLPHSYTNQAMIQCRMQCQIKRLNENFEQAQLRILGLQTQVATLRKSASSTGDGEAGDGEPQECACKSFFDNP